jgi:hypothetical protein
LRYGGKFDGARCATDLFLPHYIYEIAKVLGIWNRLLFYRRSIFRPDADTLRLPPQIFFPLPAEISSTRPEGAGYPGVWRLRQFDAGESVGDVLKLAGREQFAEFRRCRRESMGMRASAIGWVPPRIFGAGIPNAGSFVGLAPGWATALKEDVDTVCKSIEQITPN